MNIKKIILSKKLFTRVLTAVLIAAMLPALPSCVKKEDNVELPANWPCDKTSAGIFTLISSNAELTVEIQNGLPYVTSLKTEKGVEKIGSKTLFTLPLSYDIDRNFGDFDWKYTGFRKFKGERGSLGYILSFSDKTVKVSYDMYIAAYPDEGSPFEIFGYFNNNSKKKISVEPEEFFTVSVKGNSVPVTWTFDKEGGMAQGWQIYSGQFYAGTGIKKKELSEGEITKCYTTTCQDWNMSGDIPMVYVDYGTDGVCFALEWTNGTLKAKGAADNEALLTVNLTDSSFKTNVPGKKSMYFPSVYLFAYDGDVDEGSNGFRRWFLNYKAPECMKEDENEPLTQQDMQIGIDVSEYGIQSVKWDYGWWDNAPICQSNQEGLLRVESKSYLGVMDGYGCSNLRDFTDKAKEKDVKLALYILLKDTGLDEKGVPTSVGANGHPEWFSNRVVTVRPSADLGNEECVEFYKKYLGDFFRGTGVTTWRSDFEPIASFSDKENRHRANGNDCQYWCTVGFRDLVDYLYENVDGFRYESCSSGGSMKDFFTMSKAAVINCDDSADYMSLHMSFYDSSYCVHPAQLQLPCNALTYTPGSQYYTGTADYLYGLRCIMTGGVMLSNWNGTTDEDRSYWSYWINEVYNGKMKPLIREGDLYHILPRPDGINWDGLEYVDADSEREIKGLVMLWKPTNTEGSSKTVILRGLDADKTYSLTFEDRPEQNRVMSGSQLMESGLTVVIEEETGSEMVWITEA